MFCAELIKRMREPVDNVLVIKADDTHLKGTNPYWGARARRVSSWP